MKTETACGLTKECLEHLRRVFSQWPQIEKVIVYGSRAKGNFRDNSDIDLTLVGDLTISDLLAIENALDDLLLIYKIDLSILRDIENKNLLEHIQRVGKVFYERG
jgi:predicted nucleotidyltransferase